MKVLLSQQLACIGLLRLGLDSTACRSCKAGETLRIDDEVPSWLPLKSQRTADAVLIEDTVSGTEATIVDADFLEDGTLRVSFRCRPCENGDDHRDVRLHFAQRAEMRIGPLGPQPN
jgi:hypothetical protein